MMLNAVFVEQKMNCVYMNKNVEAKARAIHVLLIEPISGLSEMENGDC